MEVTYKTIKAIVTEGGSPSVDLIDQAIKHQLGAVVTYAASLAKHAAKLKAAEFHPFPLPEDQEGRVERRAFMLEVEHQRLARLYFWRELAANFATAPAGLGSA